MTALFEDSCPVSSCLHWDLIPCHHILISCRVKSFQMGRLKGRCYKDRTNWAKAATMSRLRLQRESEVHHWRCRWERWYAEEGSSCEVRADTQDEEIDHSVWVKLTYTNIFFLSTGFRQHAQSSWQHFILSYQFLPEEVHQPKISKQRSRASSFIALSRIKLLLCPPNGVGPGSSRTGLAFALHLVHMGAATWLVSGWLISIPDSPSPLNWKPTYARDHPFALPPVALLGCYPALLQGSCSPTTSRLPTLMPLTRFVNSRVIQEESTFIM